MKCYVSVLAFFLAAAAHADCCNSPPAPSAPPPVSPPPTAQGSPSFCLYEVSVDDSGKRKWINLGIVQYIDLNRSDLRVYYGGGNFGGGYEVKVAVASAAEGLALLDRMRQAAAACR